MGWDLYLGIALLVAASAVCWRWGVALGDRFSPAGNFALLALSVTLYAAYSVFLFGELALARLLPVSNVIVLGNWLLPGAAFLAGFLHQRREVPGWRRGLLSAALLVGGLYSVGGPLLSDPPEPGDRWGGLGICRQTTDASCSPCAAATLLKLHGIASNEAEMMRLCLTEKRGTRDLGLYRGLKLKTRDTAWDVEPFRGTVDDLRDPAQWPAVLLVRLDADTEAAREYRERCGWLPGVGHAVVLFGTRPDGRLAVADPAVGLEYWTVEEAELLWHGQGLRLVPRDPRMIRCGPGSGRYAAARLPGLSPAGLEGRF